MKKFICKIFGHVGNVVIGIGSGNSECSFCCSKKVNKTDSKRSYNFQGWTVAYIDDCGKLTVNGDFFKYVDALRKREEEKSKLVKDLRKTMRLSLPFIDKKRIPDGLAVGLMLMSDEELDN